TRDEPSCGNVGDILSADDLGGPQKLRADGEIDPARRLEVDLQTDPVRPLHQRDHSATGGEVIEIADRENAAVLEVRQNVLERMALRAGDEKNVAVLDFLGRAI